MDNEHVVFYTCNGTDGTSVTDPNKTLGRMVGPKGTWPIHLYLHICPYYVTDSTKDFRQTRDSIDYEYNPQGSQNLLSPP